MAEQTQLDAASKAILDNVAARSADLKDGADVAVPKGNEATPPPRVHALDARKALYAKVNAKHDADMATGNALAFNEDMQRATQQPPAVQPPRQPEQQQPPAQPLANQPQDEYVTIQYQGRSVRVSAADIQRAGSEELYVRRRELADQSADLARRAGEMRRREAELDAAQQNLSARQADLSRSTAAPHDGAATLPGSSPGTTPTPSGDSSADMLAKAEQLAARIYSGDIDDAKQAILDLMMEGRRHAVSPEQIDAIIQQRVAELARTQAPAPSPSGGSGTQPVNDPVYEAMVAEVNAVTSREYGDVVNDPIKRQLALAKFNELVMKPENADRLAVDIACDACDYIRHNGQPRQAALDLKRGLPPSPSASGTAPAAPGEQAPLSNSDYVAMLARRRRGEL